MEVGVPNGQILYEDRLAHQVQPLSAILKIERKGLVARSPCARSPRTVAAACGKNHDRKNREQKEWFHSSSRSAVRRCRITRNRGVAEYILQHARSEVGNSVCRVHVRSRTIGWGNDYQYIDIGKLPKTDARTGYPTATLLWKGKDIFGMPVPMAPFPEPA